MKRQLSRKRREAWHEARVQSYLTTRSAESLARMLVDLEDESETPAEFDYDDEWPSSVRGMKP